MISSTVSEQTGIGIPKPSISVILPVYDGQAYLERAVHSVIDQTFANWELLAVDDCSSDDSPMILDAWAKREPRLRLFRTPENGGQCVARNLALRHARGELLCYLDQDDEYFADYLATIDQWREESEVLVSRYDLVFDDAASGTPDQTWRPDESAAAMFLRLIATPLGVAHRRDLIEKVGGFNELLWSNEDWDLWRRFARAGAGFTYLSSKSGRFHVRNQSQSRSCRLTPKQKETFDANRLAGKPLFGDRPRHALQREIKKIAFVSPHSIVDMYNGASVATLNGLQCLRHGGFDCQAFCGSRLDAPDESLIEDQLERFGASYDARWARIGDYQGRMVFSLVGGVPVTSFGSASSRGIWNDNSEIAAFLTAFTRFLDKNRPDVVMTYGGDPVSLEMIEQVKSRDIPVVFTLHNFLYTHPAPFSLVDYVTVPSEFCRQHYWNTLRLACQWLPNVIDWQRVAIDDWQPRCVAFVNPEPAKGVYVFVRIAAELAIRRPDIPLLVVESRGRASTLAVTELNMDFKSLPNVHWMKTTPDPREFYRITKLVLMPSLWNENSPLVPAEAMLNGIPVLASNRGGLPETLGKAGFLFDIPDQYTPETRLVPATDEVEPWIETIIRLWDDASFYEQASRAAKQEALRWHPDRIVAIYQEFFRNVCHQPLSPILPR
jgi:glycosyltransferase involved in cell wall biosynthesis/GT2 family glycosyltransferase